MSFYHLSHILFFKPNLAQRCVVVVFKYDIAKNEGFMMNGQFMLGEVEIPTIVQKPVVIRLCVLPRPVLPCEFAIRFIFLRNGIALIIALHTVKRHLR